MRKSQLGWTFVVAVSSFACALVQGAQLRTDDFQAGTTAGWLGSFITPPSVQPSGGPAGLNDAFLLVSSNSPTGPGSSLSTHNSTSDWVGDFAGVAASKVSVDLMSPVGSSLLELRVVLFGPQFLSERWTSSNAATVPNDGVWRSFEFSLAEPDLTRVGGTNSYGDLVGNVIRLMLRHDEDTPSAGGSPIDGSFGIDNIQLVGEPQTLAGDFDLDGDVDGADFLKWQQGESPVPLSSSDLDKWKTGFGTDLSLSTSKSILVPEPSTWVLLLLGIIGLRRTCE